MTDMFPPPELAVTYARTENLFNGEPCPPDGYWAAVAHSREHTIWRHIDFQQTTPLGPLPLNRVDCNYLAAKGTQL